MSKDWGALEFFIASKVLDYLGIGTSASAEPGADRRRDHICGLIAEALEMRDVHAVEPPEPIGYCSEYGLHTLSTKAHHYALSVNKAVENEFQLPIYAGPVRIEEGEFVLAVRELIKAIQAEPRTNWGVQDKLFPVWERKVFAPAYRLVLDLLHGLDRRVPETERRVVEFDRGDIIHYLEEAFAFAAMSPGGRDNIGTVLELLEAQPLYVLAPAEGE